MNRPVFYDTDCLECFLFVNAGYILEELFSKIVIPEQVYNEIMVENTPSVVKENFKNLNEGFVEIREILFASEEYITFKSIERGFWSATGQVCGTGESAAMALAHLNDGILASNNLRDVSEYVESLNIDLITSSMILSEAYEKGIISKDTADSLWDAMIDIGIKLPKDSFLDYYHELFEKDCKNFLSKNKCRAGP